MSSANPNQIFFVTETYLKRNTSITSNVDIKDVLPLIKPAADMWTRSILGTYFYDYMLTKFNTVPNTMTANELTLLDYMQSAISWRAASDAVIELSYQLKNKGVQTQSGDFSGSPEYKAITWVSGAKAQKAEFYEGRLETYLRANKDLYSQFVSNLNNDSIAKKCDDNNTFNSGIMFI